jgi:hypothetical protein
MLKAEKAVVGYFDLDNHDKFIEIGETTTWCWQQSCRLMWFTENLIIYNKIVDSHYGSVLYDIERKEEVARYNFPIYDKSSDNKYALSLNFSRLQYLRPGYGYCNFLKEKEKSKILEDDGIYLCLFETNSKRLLLSIEDIIAIDRDERMKNAYHYVNHLKFFQDNKRFVFYHIWTTKEKRYTRAIFADIEGNILRVIDNKTFVSHDTFKNDSEYLVYTETEKIRAYHLYNLEDNNYKIIHKGFRADGHPSFIDNKNILTDTYPDRFLREQKIILFNDKELKILARIFSPTKYKGEVRCDLHPRLSSDKKKIIVDIPTFDGRNLMVISLD